MSAVLSDELQVWGVEDDVIIYTDGSIGFGLELSPIDVSCADNYQANDLHENLCKFLNSLPSGIDIQFIQEITEGNRVNPLNPEFFVTQKRLVSESRHG